MWAIASSLWPAAFRASRSTFTHRPMDNVAASVSSVASAPLGRSTCWSGTSPRPLRGRCSLGTSPTSLLGEGGCTWRRGVEFIRTNVEADRPFFLYAPMIQMHFPNWAHPDFDGTTGHGDRADSLVELDHRVGQLLDVVDELGIANETIFIFASDNGPEFRNPWRGTAGFWRGTYHTAMEGSLRVPCIMRWPGRVASGAVSNEIVHIPDVYGTFATVAGVTDLPVDRPIDSIDQSGFLFGDAAKSSREGFLFWIKKDLRAVKWRDWKLHYWWEPEVNEGKGKLEAPYLFNLIQDPKEETNVAINNTWVSSPISRMVYKFNQSLIEYPPIPPGVPDPFDPATLQGR